MGQEQLHFRDTDRFLGHVRLEDPAKDLRSYAFYLFCANLYHKSFIRKLDSYGKYPSHGAAIIIPNHRSYWDPALIHYLAAITASRDAVTVAKHTSVNTSIPEDPEELKARGKKPT